MTGALEDHVKQHVEDFDTDLKQALQVKHVKIFFC